MPKKRVLHSLRRNQGGFILPIVLVLFGLGILLLAPTLGHGYTGMRASAVTETKAEELHAADAGMEDAVNWLLQGDAADERYSDPGTGDYTRDSTIALNGTWATCISTAAQSD